MSDFKDPDNKQEPTSGQQTNIETPQHAELPRIVKLRLPLPINLQNYPVAHTCIDCGAGDWVCAR